jgi:hypothetical protein
MLHWFPMTKKPLVATSILLLMLTLATTDALLVEKNLLTDWRHVALQENPSSTDPPPTNPLSNQQSGGVTKVAEVNVTQIAVSMGLEVRETTESTLLSQIVPPESTIVHSVLLLKNNDRAGVLSWVDSPDGKMYFLALKEALHATFSPQLKDLVDETQQREGHPVRNLLTFKDPLISEERVVFVRLRERMYEVHVANTMDDVIFELVEKLTE